MLRLYTSLIFLALTLILAENSLASPTFLEGFVFGTPRDKILERPGAMSGSENFKEDVFFKKISWAGFSWSMQCHFANSKLDGLTLYGSYEAEKLKRLSVYLKEQKFQLLGLVIDNTALDIITLVKLGGQEAFQKRFRELVKAKTPSTIRYEWFEGLSLTEDNLRMAASLSQLLTLVDMNTVQIEVAQERVGEKQDHAVLSVHFSCPILREVAKEKSSESTP